MSDDEASTRSQLIPLSFAGDDRIVPPRVNDASGTSDTENSSADDSFNPLVRTLDEARRRRAGHYLRRMRRRRRARPSS